MAVFETWLKSDLQKAVQVKSIQGNLFSADNAGNLIGVVVTDGGSPAEITGNVTAYIIRADGATVVAEGSISGNRVSVTLPASAYAVVGQASIVIKVGTTTVGACTIYVYRSTTDTIVDPGSVIPSIEELLEQVEACRTATANANTAATGANTAATNANTKAGLAETAAGNANTAAGKINNMTVAATTLPAGSEATVSITEDQVDGHKHILFGVPKGVSGNETIDDTAGEGDTDKVWSADKSYAEITPLKNNVIVESASGSIASFADGADGMPLRSLSVAIEPVQDLHGYDHPWPAGGGKNKLKVTAVSSQGYGITRTVSEDGVITITGTATSLYTAIIGSIDEGSYIINGCPSGGSETTYRLDVRTVSNGSIVAIDYGNGSSAFTIEEPCNVVIRIPNGATVNNAVFKPMIRLATETDPTYVPYSNLCPISGWTGAEVTRTGKNLFPDTMTWELGAYGNVGNKVTVDDRVRTSSYIFLLANTQYTLSFDSSHILQRICQYDSDDQFISNIYTGTFTTAPNCSHISITANTTDTNVVCQLELGSTATTYEPYQGNTYDITFPSSAGTVYGGTLDVTTGVLTVTYASELIKDVPWSYTTNSGGYFRAYSSNAENIVKLADAGQTDALCSCYKTAQANTSSALEALDKVYVAGGRVSVYKLIIKDTDYTTVSDFVAARGEERLTYELRVPVTHTLTQQEVKTLLGNNNIWADTGDVSVSYPADTKLYIDGKIAEIQALILENISNS